MLADLTGTLVRWLQKLTCVVSFHQNMGANFEAPSDVDH